MSANTAKPRFTAFHDLTLWRTVAKAAGYTIRESTFGNGTSYKAYEGFAVVGYFNVFNDGNPPGGKL